MGWLATILFALSYLTERALYLLMLQASAGILWVIYGSYLGAAPVVVDNGVVAVGALYRATKVWQRHKLSRSNVDKTII